MAYQKVEHKEIANFLDDIEYLQGLLLTEIDYTDTFRKHLIGIEEKYKYKSLLEEFSTKVNEHIGVYLVEVKFKINKCFDNRLMALKYYKNILTQSNIVDKGIEHDSIHYVEHIYYKWKKGNVKVKLYIDDYQQNGLCFDIESENKNYCINISEQINKLISLESNSIEVVKNWES
jgi:hypothetical protein